MDGYTPYADFKLEYPPGALLLFTLPRIFTEVPALYGYIFAFIMFIADLGILLFFWRIPALVRGTEVKADMQLAEVTLNDAGTFEFEEI